jgi:outer membrane protein assembly factor BamD
MIVGLFDFSRVQVDIFLLGDCYVRTKEYATAALELERLLRDYPESDSAAAAAFRLGDAYWGQARPWAFDQAQTLQALEQWQVYLRAYPGHWQNDVARARMALARGRLAEKAFRTGELYVKLALPGPARLYFEQVIEQFPDTIYAAEAVVGLARVAEQQGQLSEALHQLERVQSEYPGSPAARRAEQERARLQRKIERGKS